MGLYRMKKGYGRHRLILKGRTVDLSPGDRIECEDYDIGNALDKFEVLVPNAKKLETPAVAFSLEQLPSGKWNVRSNATRRLLNDAPLTEEEAMGLATGAVDATGLKKRELAPKPKPKPKTTTLPAGAHSRGRRKRGAKK